MGHPKTKLEKKWIQDGITKETVDWAEEFGKYLAVKEIGKEPLTTSQLRRFFGELKRIDTDFESNKVDLPMLKPMLAYAVGRDKKNGKTKTRIDDFYDEMSRGLEAIRETKDGPEEKDFKHFVRLVESIVAYHKFYEVNKDADKVNK